MISGVKIMKKKVLFLCTGNSCRSQMAEGLLKFYYDDKYKVYSAGTKPSTVNQYAVGVMKELGIDISHQYSKHIDELKDIVFDSVITVCDNAKESCPAYFGKAKKLHWSFEDPANATGVEEEILEKFREIRDQIKDTISYSLDNELL